MIDIRKLKELVKLMVENDLTELDLQDTDETVNIRRGASEQTVINQQPAFYGGAAPVPAAHAPAPAGESAPAPAPAAAKGDDGLKAIESPMVGTFYSKPTPDAESFAGTGTSVGPDTTVCLVEAMKVFNEIKAETSGTIERVLVKDGDAVEFGQPLFMVRPA